jgi:hypothetical protein
MNAVNAKNKAGFSIELNPASKQSRLGVVNV